MTTINISYINEHPNIEEARCLMFPYREVYEAELDEMRSFVRSNLNPKWLWLALDHETGRILAYTFGKRKDEVFAQFQELLKPFMISFFIQMIGVVINA